MGGQQQQARQLFDEDCKSQQVAAVQGWWVGGDFVVGRGRWTFTWGGGGGSNRVPRNWGVAEKGSIDIYHYLHWRQKEIVVNSA